VRSTSAPRTPYSMRMQMGSSAVTRYGTMMNLKIGNKGRRLWGGEASSSEEEEEENSTLIDENGKELMDLNKSCIRKEAHEEEDDHKSSSSSSSSSISSNTEERTKKEKEVVEAMKKSASSCIYYFMLGYVCKDRKEVYDKTSTHLIWFTYRHDFREIAPYGYTSDAGWGCMLRSAQMLLCYTLQCHQVATSSSNSNNNNHSDMDSTNPIWKYFIDQPTNSQQGDGWFSIHNMVAVGMKYNQLPGEWYSPGIACHIVRDLVRQQHQLPQHTTNTPATKLLRVYIAQEGTVYQDRIHHFMTSSSSTTKKPTASSHSSSTENAICKVSFHPLTPDEDEYNNNEKEKIIEEWDGSLLLFIPLRLGLNSFQTETYGQSLCHIFSLSSSVGILGGSPRHALWFYASSFPTITTTTTTTTTTTMDTNFKAKWYGLDPHTIQPALSSSSSPPQPCYKPCEVDLHKIDPSMALGFYFYQRQDFVRWCQEMKQIYTIVSNARIQKGTNQSSLSLSSSDLFPIISHSIPWTQSKTINDYLGDSSSSSSVENCTDDEVTNEVDDEYVFL